ncbi:MAG: FumA C-terminus/TtdB family hydratase beta subunit [Candidatus Omnitrophica bacterium]|nr:FumA C-terminus/TtdB family hydratase beta subunit [Candidatus Omnitrophota bacterium]MCM8828465.1 FumA C-terminus/TtdB family hydratase beta subunit [Candidatus Omnitrophota bacterium]
MKKIITPLEQKIINELVAGEFVEISGLIYGARDAAHKILFEMLKSKKNLPFDLRNQTIYYVGPTPAPPGKIIGSCGPTTSSRMDRYTPDLLRAGLKGMIGKGIRSDDVRKAIVKYGAVYFITYGGCGAYLSQFVKKSEAIAFCELGPEAIYRMVVENFPAIVGIDSKGRGIYSF